MAFQLLLAVTLVAASVAAQATPPVEPATTVEPPMAVESPIAPPSVESVAAPKAILPKGTMVRLMVLNEVNSRDHKAGHRFVLRADEDVKIGSTTIIPVGAKAWGEVVDAEATGGAGKSGRLNARLIFVEAMGRQITLDGARHSAGGNATGAVVASVIAFGPLGLLMKGNNAKLKAGEILNGYTLEEQSFDLPGVVAKP